LGLSSVSEQQIGVRQAAPIGGSGLREPIASHRMEPVFTTAQPIARTIHVPRVP